MLLQLPPLILENILKHLGVKDVINLMCVCKSLNSFILCNSPIWKFIYREKIILHSPISSSSSQNIITTYHQCRISHNWRRGIFRNKILIESNTKYMPWLKFNSEVLLLSLGSQLRCYATNRKGLPVGNKQLWKLEVPKINRRDIRTNDISRFIINNNFIVCGNRDGCVAIYDASNIKVEKPFLICHIEDCHNDGQDEVSAVETVHNNDECCIVTGSFRSPEVAIWKPGMDFKNLSTPTYRSTIRIKLAQYGVGARSLSTEHTNKRLAIGLNGNSTPLFIDLIEGREINNPKRTRDVKQITRDIRWHDANTVISVAHEKLHACDVRTEQTVFAAMDPFSSALYCLASDGNNAVVVGAAEYSRCVLYDLRSSKSYVQTYFTQKQMSPVYSLAFDTTKLIAAADRKIAALNFNVNSSIQERDYSQPFEIVNA